MEEQLQAIIAETESALASVEARSRLDQVKASILGGNGKLTVLMKGIASVPKEERPAFGQAVNKAKKQSEALLAQTAESLDNAEDAAALGKTRMNSCRGPFAAAWLIVCPTTEHLKASNRENAELMPYTLG